MTAAARELGTSPASLSRGMKSLERQLSARLLKRHGNGVRLTEAGRRYHEGVTAALGRLHASAAAAMQLSQDASVVIACSLDDSHLLVMPSSNRSGGRSGRARSDTTAELLSFRS